MEAAVRVAGEGVGRTEEGEGKEGRLSLNFGHASSHLYHQQHHPKLLRSDAFPFRRASGSTSIDASAASDGRARLPSSPQTFAFPTNGGIGGGGGGTAVFGYGGVSDSHGTPRALQRTLVAHFDSPGLAGDATLQLCSAFTAAQWQELHRQALIFKHIVASAPVPPELLFGPRPFPDVPPILNCGAVGRGSDYLNLRFTAAAGGDLEPGRCRRTDGKKWRCSRDVAPGQKYCERHVHRARPRSRKPVELDRGPGPAAANAAEAVSTTSGAMEHTTPTATAGSSSAAARPCTPSSPGLLPSGADLKFPFQFMVPQDRKLRALVSTGGGDAEAQAAAPQWQLLQSKMGLKGTTSVLQQQQQHQDDLLTLNCNSLSDHHGCPFPSTDISAFEDLPVPHDRRGTPRLFIDAWSRSPNPFHGVTNKDNHRSTTDSGAGRISFRTPGNLSPSNLTLSMSGTCGGGGRGEDQVHFQMGIRAADSGRMLAPSWMSPGSPIGGPLGEVLQTSTSTVSLRNEHAGAGRDNDAARGGAGLIIDLMSKTGCDSCEGTSPREGGATRRFPSPTRVLQGALISLSDSSSNSSLTFGAGPRAELGLQWASPSN